MKKIIRFVLYFALSFSLLHSVDVPTSNYSGSRSKSWLFNPSGGITSEGAIGSLLSYTINWTITDLGGGNFRYLYSLSNIAGLSAAQSDFFLELGTNTSLSNLSNIKVNSGLVNALTGVTVSDATFRGDHGVLFDSTASLLINSISFDVAAAPVWGDFFQGSTLGILGNVKNTGFGTNYILGNSPTNWIPTVGNVSMAIPEPSLYLLLGSCLLIVFCTQRRRTAKAS